jgi:hypothetical protein
VADPDELETLLQSLQVKVDQLLAEARDPSTTPVRNAQIKEEARRILQVLEGLLQNR